MAFSRAAAMSSPAWIALSMAAISRTLVESTWLKMLPYQFTVGSLKKAPMPDSVLVNDSQLAGTRYARTQGAGSTGALHHRVAQAVHSGRARSGARRSRARPVVAAGRSVRLL